VTVPQGDEADHPVDAMTTTEIKIAIEIIENAATDLEAVVASNGKKSAKMTAKEEKRG
jgi:Cu2+-containing amine oxidase